MTSILGGRRGLATILVGLAAACGGDDPSGPPPAELVIVTESLPAAVHLAPYSAGINAEGGAGGYTWSVTGGALPPGLQSAVEDLSDDDLSITGSAQQQGTFSVTFRVRSADGQEASRTFTIVVQAAPSAVQIANLGVPPALLGAGYDVPLRAEGGVAGAITWTLTQGSLPPGIQLIGGGRLSGTPTATGSFPITLTASSGGLSDTASFTLVVVPSAAGYQITPHPVVPVPANIQPHLDAAIARWQQVLTTDLPQVSISPTFFAASFCGGFGLEVNGTSVDDLLIVVNIAAIDGVGSVLGQAGPCGIRGSNLPHVGVLTLDQADLAPLVGTTTLTAIITHEIGHVLGIGSLWDRFNLLEGEGGTDPRFLGSQAVAAYQAAGGVASKVPVENQGGEGTRDGHWRESVFNTELMTGFSEPVGVAQPLSRITVASLADLGYGVNVAAADPYTVPAPLIVTQPQAAPPDLGYDIVGVGPVRVAPAVAVGPTAR